MQKAQILTLFCLLLSSFAIGQYYTGDSVGVIAYWEKGEVMKYEFSTIKKESEDGEETITKDSKIIVSFEILEENEDFYIVSYKKEKILKAGGEEYADGFEQLIFKSIFDKVEYRFKTDYYGEFIELLNWEEVRDNTLKLLKVSSTIADIKDKEERESILNFMEEMYSSQENVEMMLFKEIGYLFNFHGYIYELDTVLVYDDVLPNLFSDDLIPAKGSQQTTYDEDMGSILFINTLAIDEEVGGQVMKEMMKGVIKDMGVKMKKSERKELEEAMESMKFNIQDNHYTLIDAGSGWVLESKFNRTISVKDLESSVTKTEIFHFKLLLQDENDEVEEQRF